MHNEARTASFTMRYFYRTQEGFHFPELGDAQPAVGTVVPYIRKTATDSPVKGEPLAVRFTLSGRLRLRNSGWANRS